MDESKTCRTGLHRYDASLPRCPDCKRRANSDSAKRHRAHAIAQGAEWREKNRERAVWSNMLRRCTDESNERYADYGGRGIKVCDRWQGEDGYRNFLTDMGRRPSPYHTLDRENNDGNYEPGNCHWATYAEQNRNRRDTRLVTHGGKTLCLQDWARETGLKRATIKARLDLMGWPVEKALSKKARHISPAKNKK